MMIPCANCLLIYVLVIMAMPAGTDGAPMQSKLAKEKAKPQDKPSNVTVVTHINNASIALSKSTNGTVLPTEKYCERYKHHYAHFCAAPKNETTHTEAKPDKFCSSFEANCIQPAVNKTADNNDNRKRADFDENTVPLVLPPPIPFAASDNPGRQENDSPIITGSASSPNSVGPVAVLPVPVAKDTNTPLNAGAGGFGGGAPPSIAIVPGGGSGGKATMVPVIPITVTDSPALINHCTPDCNDGACTTKCKCEHTHLTVQAKCNPPLNADVASTCQAWYAKCPMYKPINFGHS